MVVTVNINVNLYIGQESKVEPLINILHLILFINFMLKNCVSSFVVARMRRSVLTTLKPCL